MTLALTDAKPDLSFLANCKAARARLRNPSNAVSEPSIVAYVKPPAPTPILSFTRIQVIDDPLADDELPRWPWSVHRALKFRDFRTVYTKPIGPPSTMHERAWLILRAKADIYDFTIDEIRGQQRKDKIVRARHHAMWEMSKYTTWSLGQIGKFFGDKDHTTVLHGIRKHQNELTPGR